MDHTDPLERFRMGLGWLSFLSGLFNYVSMLRVGDEPQIRTQVIPKALG